MMMEKLKEFLKKNQEQPVDINLFLTLKSWGSIMFAALLLALSIRSAVADWNIVPSKSMNPTIIEGDRILVNKLAYDLKLPFTNWPLFRWGDPHRGDIAVFSAPVEEIPMVKRVVGLPGDYVLMKDNQLYINGRPVAYETVDGKRKDVLAPECDYFQKVLIENLYGRKHPVVLTPYRPSKDFFGPLIIPPGYYFMLGDNRDNSADSRYFGLVERFRIMGRAAAVMISLNSDDDNRPRWRRFFTPLF